MTAPPEGIARSSGVMALGTLASRLTGFLRVAVMVYALGIREVADAYNLANTMPNIVYELLLGGVLTSVVVPLVVQAAHDDGDDGASFSSSLLAAVVTLLGGAVVVLMVAAPWLVRLLAPGDPDGDTQQLATTFLRYFVPQILFYGVGATITAVLNTRRIFGAPMFAPVLNNVVVIATALYFTTLPGSPTPAGLTETQVAVLGVGTTLGVVVMTLALLPSLRRSGFQLRLAWRWHPGLGRALRLGAWVAAYVAANQLGLFVVIRLALASAPGGLSSYQYAFILFQLPHAIVTVSIVSALLPRLSEHAVAGRLDELRGDVSYGLRLVTTLLVPAAVGLAVLAMPLAVVILSYGSSSVAEARFVGEVLAVFALGLASFSVFQLFLRVYYALQDTRTPALLNIACVAVNVGVALLLFQALDGRDRVLGLAAGHAVAYTVGAVVFALLLRRRLGGLDGRAVGRLLVRVAGSAAVMGLAAYGASRLVLGDAERTAARGAAAVAVGLLVGLPFYLVSARRLAVAEVGEVTRMVTARFRRG